MSEPIYEYLTEVYDPIIAEMMIEGLKAQGFDARLSHESARAAIPLTFGELGKIEIYVLAEQIEAARAWLEASENNEIPVVEDTTPAEETLEDE